MTELSILQAANAAGAAYSGANAVIRAISTDSRDIPHGCLFIALEGERFDGHAFIEKALEQGAAYALAMRPGSYSADERVLTVSDTGQALLDIAGCYRDTMPAKIVGITGSVGKTTTRDMVACVLFAAMPTLCTKANLNNEIGLPKTLLELTPEHRAAVLEMGMDGPGQIRRMAHCARPDVGIITNIGVSHIEHLGSRENILAAKMELCEGMADGATLILCGDDELLKTVKTSRLRVMRYGIYNKENDVLAADIETDSTYTAFTVLYNGKRLPTRIPALGEHNVLAALAAFCAGTTLGIEPERALEALQEFSPTGMRQKMVDCRGFTVVEDCYNASPDSMRAALRTLGTMPCKGRRIAVLSDMLELGGIAEQSHYKIGRLAAENAVDCLLCTGELAKQYAEGAKQGGLADVRYYSDKASLAGELCAMLKPGDIVWLKASRGMRLEEVLTRIYE